MKFKTKPSTQANPNLQAFAQKFDKITNELMQGQMAMMNKLNILDEKKEVPILIILLSLNLATIGPLEGIKTQVVARVPLNNVCLTPLPLLI